MGTLIDAKFEAYRGAGFTGAMSDMELAWLQDNGATSGDKTTAWMEMLTAAGFTTGSLVDRQIAFWLDAGAEGDTYSDIAYDYYTNHFGGGGGGSFTPPTNNPSVGFGSGKTILSNWGIPASGGTQAQDATDYLGTPNAVNTFTISVTAGQTLSWDISNFLGGVNWYGAAVKAGSAGFVTLYTGATTSEYAIFDVSSGVVAAVTSGRTASIHSLGGGWYWCQIDGLGGSNSGAKVKYALNATDAIPGNTFTSNSGKTVQIGPFAAGL